MCLIIKFFWGEAYKAWQSSLTCCTSALYSFFYSFLSYTSYCTHLQLMEGDIKAWRRQDEKEHFDQILSKKNPLKKWYPLLSFSLRLWRRDPASPRSSTSKQTVSANIFCAEVLERRHLGSSQSKKTQLCLRVEHVCSTEQKIAAMNQGRGSMCILKKNTHYFNKGEFLRHVGYDWNPVGRLIWTNSGTINHIKGLF